MAIGSNIEVQQQEKLVKKKTWTARPQINAPEHDKVKKTISPGNDLDRIRAPQKERNVAQQINKQQDQIPAPKLQASKVSKREQVQLGQKILTRSPAQERMKKSEVNVLRRLQYSSDKMSRVQPLQPTPNGNQATVRTTVRAQALLVEMVQQSRLTQQHGLPRLATHELHNIKQRLAEVKKVMPGGEAGEVTDSRKKDGVGKRHSYLQEDDVVAPRIVITEVSVSTEPRFITPKEVSFEDCTSGSQKIDEPPSVDENHSLRDEMENEQELRMAQEEATSEEGMSNLRRVKGGGDSRKYITTESFQAISSASTRREVMRQGLIERRQQDLVRKFKMLISLERAAAAAPQKCKCCLNR